MGANAQTSVPVFTSGQVLTAAQQTEINTGIPVFATSVERDAAFGGTGLKTLAEGQFAFLEDSDTTQYYDGSTWETVGVAPGLVLIKTKTIDSAVSFATVSDAFSADYDNYKIVLTGGVGSASDSAIALKLGSTTTGYYEALIGLTYANSGNNSATSNGANFSRAGQVLSTSVLFANIDLLNPNLAQPTIANYSQVTSTLVRVGGGFLNDSTQYTAFTFTPATGTLTGGTIKVYGYVNS